MPTFYPREVESEEEVTVRDRQVPRDPQDPRVCESGEDSPGAQLPGPPV